MYIGGGIALDVVTKYTGKFELIHVKDEIPSTGNEPYESAILGKGIIKVKDVLEICRKTGGTKAYVVEQESYQGKDPIACIKENFEIMKGWGY
jgi:L-ribulose-5-phosphate 3-epimerase UlaE